MKLKNKFKAILCMFLSVLMMFSPMMVQVSSADTENDSKVHNVNFYDVNNEVIRTEMILHNEECDIPPTPEIPEGMQSFVGWFLKENMETDEAYDFTEKVTTDLDLYAVFSDKVLIQFEDAFGKIIKQEYLDLNSKVQNPDDLIILSPNQNHIFTGEWKNKETSDIFDFTKEISENMTLIPSFEKGSLVQFVTNGNFVEPQIVPFDGKIVKPSDEPTRSGYTFVRWAAEENGTQDFDFDEPVTENISVYAVWEAKKVEYKVVYWLEKENIPIAEMNSDISNGIISQEKYDFVYSEVREGAAGSSITIQKEQVPTNKEFKEKLLMLSYKGSATADGAPYSQFYKSTTSEIAGDGTTIINVYYTRKVFTFKYVLSLPAGYKTGYTLEADFPHEQVVLKGNDTYTYTIDAKVGLNISSIFPAVFTPGSQGQMNFKLFKDAVGENPRQEILDRVVRGWGPWSVSLVDKVVLNKLNIGESVNSYKDGIYTINVSWSNKKQFETIRYTYVESLDQESSSETRPIDDKVPGYHKRLHVEKLKFYGTNGYVNVAANAQHFDMFNESRKYWAAEGDRQVTDIMAGFTAYSKETSGNNSNCYQWNNGTEEMFYQLNTTTNNRNDSKRYYFFKRDSFKLTFETFGHGKIQAVNTVKYEESLEKYEPSEKDLNLGSKEVFLGWYLDPEFNLPFEFDGAIMPGGDLELYAKIKTEDHKVTFIDKNDGETIHVEGVGDGETLTQPDMLFEVGKTYKEYGEFVGWYFIFNDQPIKYNWETPVKGDITLVGVWKSEGFTITYDLDGGETLPGTVVEDKRVYDKNTFAKVSTIRNITKDSGTLLFSGWKDIENNKIYHPGQMIEVKGNIALKAIYTKTLPKVYGTITVTKTDVENESIVIDNAHFILAKDFDSERKYYTTSGKNIIWVDDQNDAEVFVTQNGCFTIDGLEVGSYTLIETQAAQGYVTPLGEEAETSCMITRDTLNIQKQIENTPVYGFLKVMKIDNESKESLSGAYFIIEKEGVTATEYYSVDTLGNVKWVLNAMEAKVFKTDVDGKCIVDQLRWGVEYSLVEIKAPTNYKLPENNKTAFSLEKAIQVTELTIENEKVDVPKIDESIEQDDGEVLGEYLENHGESVKEYIKNEVPDVNTVQAVKTSDDSMISVYLIFMFVSVFIGFILRRRRNRI